MHIPSFKASVEQQCRNALATADAAAKKFIQQMAAACKGMLSPTLDNQIQEFLIN